MSEGGGCETGSPKVIQVQIKVSKTDPFRKGVTIHLGSWRTGNELCPVSAIASYMVVRGRGRGRFFNLASGAPLSWEVLYGG